MTASEQKIYGRNACLAFARKFPNDVIRAYCTESVQGAFGFLLKQLAQQKRAYHIVANEDLAKLSETAHHEGVLLLIKRPRLRDSVELLNELSREPMKKRECLLCLDGIANPHNLGSIVRTAAHFGVKRIVLLNTPQKSMKALLSGAYHRTAEGGAVHVELFHCIESKNFIETISTKLGFNVAATSSHAKGASLNQLDLPARLLLVMGSESEGVSSEILRKAKLKICIEGTGNVESLNIASATSILLNEFLRQSQRRIVSPASKKPTLAARPLGKKRIGS